MEEENIPQEINWVKLTSFTWPHQYLTLRAFLESNDIPIYARDEMTISIDPLLSNALGGIWLFVPEEDLERAQKLLAEFERSFTKDL